MSPDVGAAAAEIHEILYTRDIAAFVQADWRQVADDFDADAFAGYSGARGDGHWELAYPTLESYRDDWLRQAADLSGSVNLEAELSAAQRLADIAVAREKALVRKEFDGLINSPSGPLRLSWTTYYFLRRSEERQRWLITGFAGYIPVTAIGGR